MICTPCAFSVGRRMFGRPCRSFAQTILICSLVEIPFLPSRIHQCAARRTRIGKYLFALKAEREVRARRCAVKFCLDSAHSQHPREMRGPKYRALKIHRRAEVRVKISIKEVSARLEQHVVERGAGDGFA